MNDDAPNKLAVAIPDGYSEHDIGQYYQLLLDRLESSNELLKVDQRASCVSALKALIDFLSKLPYRPSQSPTLSLTVLLAKLEDLNIGRRDPLFEPTKGFDNRKHDAAFNKVVKGHACFYVDVLKKTGLANEQAYRLVASQLLRNGFKIGTGKIEDWKTLKNWRERLTKLSDDEPQRRTYEALKKQFGNGKLQTNTHPKEWLNEQCSQLFGQLGKSVLE